MRVAIDGRAIQDHFPGIGRYVYNLTRALARLPERPDLTLLYDPTRWSSRFALGALAGVELLPAPYTPFDWRSQRAIPRRLRAADVDLYHSPYYLMPYWSGRPTVVTLYDTIPLIYPQYLPSGAARRAYRWLNLLAGRRARRILAISASAAGDIARHLHIPAGRIVVTPLAADERFRPLPDRAAVDAWRRAAGLPSIYVLYLGINKPHKNLVTLIRAWKLALERGLEAAGDSPALVLAGREDPRYPQTRRAALEAGAGSRIIFLGDVAEDDLPWLYNAATLFVYPSVYEGFGLPVLEAMACGTPVACSNTSSLPEVAGDAALLVEPLDIEGWAAALGRLLADAEQRRELARRGLAQAARFSWERTARQTLGAYHAALG